MFVEMEVIRESDVFTLGAQLRAVGTHVQRVGGSVVRRNSLKLRDAVRRHAEGRPGPEKITGAYWNSIQVTNDRGAGGLGVADGVYSSRVGRISRGFEAEVYSDAPQARRLEFGFVGADSAGRHYNQPPFPHWAPAIAEVEPEFFHEMDSLVDLAVAFGKTR
jgi:hypothetical protein